MPIARSVIGRNARASPTFPLTVHPSGRYLLAASGRPFPILGRTAWFITSLSVTDYTTFLDDCAAKNFTAIEFHVINHDDRGNQEPYANNGTLLPFTKKLDGSAWGGSLNDTPDFTQPNESYWSFVDSLLTACEARGLAVLMFPAYAGYQGGPQGWMAKMFSNGTTKMQNYGAFIANRYKTRGNIIWMLGGDYGTSPNTFTTGERDIEQAMVDGMTGVSGQHSTQFAAEWDSESIGTDQTTFGSYMTLNGAYSHTGVIATQMRRGYSDTSLGTKPAFIIESAYDEEGPDGNNWNGYATQPTRRFIWRGWLNGIAGYVQGNGYIWPFNTGWDSHLSSQGQNDLGRLNAFIKSIEWYSLVPHGLGSIGTLITAGGGTIDTDGYVAAAATPSGSLLVAYLGLTSGNPTIDMTKLRGTVTARWFDPSNGSYQNVSGQPFSNTGTRTFTDPGNNSQGEGDWVLRMDA